jgi:adenine specific DNA methylase Mod
LRERLIYLHEILAEDGSIYIHLDQKMGHYVKIVMDEIFEENNFRNEIVWSYGAGNPPQKDFAHKHDTIFRYAKSSS